MFIKVKYFLLVQNLNFLLELVWAEVNTLRSYVLIPKHTSKNMAFGIEIAKRHDAVFLSRTWEMTNQNQSSAIFNLKY